MQPLERLKRWVAQHKSQRAAAKVLGLSHATLSRILGGERGVGIDVALKIQQHTSITPKSWWEDR